MKPVGDRILVEPLETASEKTVGGVIIPTEEEQNRGIVKAVGMAVETVRQGDFIIFSKFGGQDVEVDGKEYLILNEADVLLVL